jgi:hypothetical protein
MYHSLKLVREPSAQSPEPTARQLLREEAWLLRSQRSASLSFTDGSSEETIKNKNSTYAANLDLVVENPAMSVATAGYPTDEVADR